MLTEKQQAILDFINKYVDENGFPPSVREIGRNFGIYPATVQDHISALERKGFLQKKRFQSRTLSVPASSRRRTGESGTGIPVVGKVAAGAPLLAQENIEEMIHLPKDWAPAGAFLLKVQGNSMEGAHIVDGDYVLVHPQQSASNGEIVVALIGDEATVKRFYRSDRGIVLKAENPKFGPIEIERSEAPSFRLIGRVMGVLRVIRK
ncbi:MAG: transcriptional repressor LexA [Acidobacteria bacterium]|nr:transcriptional repressor LexA [Acidobacteriota bacterium]